MTGALPKRAKTKGVTGPEPRRTKIASLPSELLTQIALLSDLPTAQSLARVSRIFTIPAESRIWQHVDFTLDATLYETRSNKLKILREAEDRYENALCAKARTIRSLATPRRLAKVVKVTLMPRAGATHVMVRLLEGVAPAVKELELKARSGDQRPDDYDMLDLRMLNLLNRRICFPALRFARFCRNSIRFTGLLSALCEMAPNLVTLHISISQDFSRAAAPFPSVMKPTNLRNLRIDASWGQSDEETVDAIAVLSLVEERPKLEQLSLKYTGCSLRVSKHVTKVLGEHLRLQDLYWEDYADLLAPGLVSGSGAFPSLRRMLIVCHIWDDALIVPALLTASLEILYIHRNVFGFEDDEHFSASTGPSDLEDVSRTGFFEPSPAQPMPPKFALQLKGSPHLRIVNTLTTIVDKRDTHTFRRLDEAELEHRYTGYVRSIRHGKTELLHACMLLTKAWDLDDLVIDGIEVPENVRGNIWHFDEDIALIEKIFPGEPLVTWCSFTEYERMTVPLGIIQRMKGVEGAVRPWEGRGIEVGAKAWAVLTDWKEETLRAASG